MPIGAGGIAAITAAGAVVSQGANAYSTGRMNRKNREFSEKMYNKQRFDALQDWANMNTYNSPVEQMKRLREAGLNPNLVYGNGTDLQSANIRSSEFATPKTEAPQFGNIPGEVMGKYFEVTLQKQQLENMKATENLIKAQTDSTLAQAGLKNIDLKTAKWADEGQADGFSIQQAERLNKYQKQAAETSTASANMRMRLTDEEIQNATKQTSIDAAIQKVINMRKAAAKTDSEIKNLDETYRIIKANGTIAELDAEFAGKMNKRWDNYLVKILGIILGGK